MSSILTATKNTLEELARSTEVPMAGAYYGACREKNLKEWNYFVFNRKKTDKASNRVDYQTFYQVHVVHEDYIPEGYIQKVIETLEAQKDAKLKATADPVEYNYTFKNNTDMVVEIATITLFHPEKEVLTWQRLNWTHRSWTSFSRRWRSTEKVLRDRSTMYCMEKAQRKSMIRSCGSFRRQEDTGKGRKHQQAQHSHSHRKTVCCRLRSRP